MVLFLLPVCLGAGLHEPWSRLGIRSAAGATNTSLYNKWDWNRTRTGPDFKL